MKTIPFPKDKLPKPVGIWVRVSTEDQARGDSPEHHERRAQAYAESRDWQVKEVYRLAGVSGKEVMSHPETKRMLEDVRKGRITALIFSKLARLARNTKQLLEFADLFKASGADLVSLQESIDTSSSAGRLLYTMIAALAEWEREEIADRVAVSIPIRAKMGKSLGGDAPFGYQWKDKQLIPHETEAPVRKLIYELFLELRRKKSVAQELNQRGYRTRKGKLWSDTSVAWMLRDPSAKGLHRKNYITGRVPGKRWSFKPAEEVIHFPIPAIVSVETWEKCFAILEENRLKRQRTAKRTVHLFAGFVHCHCGKKMYVAVDTPKYICQKCRNKIPILDLEAIFYEQLRGYFLSPEEVAGYLAKADATLKESEELAVTLKAERDATQKKIDRLYDDYAAERLTGDQFSRLFQPLDTRFKQLDEELPKIEAKVDVLKIDHLSSDSILTESKNLYDRWPLLNYQEKRQVVESVTEKIVVGKGDVAIELAFFPGYEDLTNEQRAVPAIASLLQSKRPAGRVAELGSLGVIRVWSHHCHRSHNSSRSRFVWFPRRAWPPPPSPG